MNVPSGVLGSFESFRYGGSGEINHGDAGLQLWDKDDTFFTNCWADSYVAPRVGGAFGPRELE
jgi:hypothetical protein